MQDPFEDLVADNRIDPPAKIGLQMILGLSERKIANDYDCNTDGRRDQNIDGFGSHRLVVDGHDKEWWTERDNVQDKPNCQDRQDAAAKFLGSNR